MIDYLLLLPIPIVSLPIFLVLFVVAIFSTQEGFRFCDLFMLFVGALATALIPLSIWLLIHSEMRIYNWIKSTPDIQVEKGR